MAATSLLPEDYIYFVFAYIGIISVGIILGLVFKNRNSKADHEKVSNDVKNNDGKTITNVSITALVIYFVGYIGSITTSTLLILVDKRHGVDSTTQVSGIGGIIYI